MATPHGQHFESILQSQNNLNGVPSALYLWLRMGNLNGISRRDGSFCLLVNPSFASSASGHFGRHPLRLLVSIDRNKVILTV